jgi:phosphatidate cytidylyltransferase
VPEGESKDDLFEDLDKFFAPIQDVDWPETKTPEDEPARPSADDTVDVRDAGEPEPSLFAHEDEPDPAALLGDAGDLEDAASPESFSQPPSAYVDLPATDDDVEAELDEPMPEEVPSAEAVEAAADHFAESVRDEVSVEPVPEPASAPGGDATDSFPVIEPDVEEPAERSTVRTVRVGAGAEGFGGPSWQEPTTVEVGAQDERRPGGRDVPAAFLTGLVLAGLAIGSIAISRAAFAVVAGLIVLWAQGELYRALQRDHHQPATALGLVGGGLVLGAGYFRGEAAMLGVFALSLVATYLWFLAGPSAHRRGATTNVALTILGVAYVPLLAAYALALLDQSTDARGLVLSVIALTFLYDTAAFVIGSLWGAHPLAPTISPKKSIEGALGATLVVIAVAVGAVAPAVHVLNDFARSAGLAVVVAVFAPLGDLAESLLKRDLGVKDMGSILPGHGGVLDRIDSLLFVAPAAFLYLRLILT